MKAKLATCTTMLVVLTANASAANEYIWTGATSAAWDAGTSPFFNDNNWDLPGWPGRNASTDEAMIKTNGSNAPTLSVSLANPIAKLTLNADLTPATVALTYSGGTNDVDGLVLVKGQQNGSATATLLVSGGTLRPDLVEFFGRNHATAGRAIGDFQASVTVQGYGSAATDTTIKGMVDLYIGNATVYLRDTEMGANANLYVFGEHANSVLQMSSMDLVDGASDYRPVRFEADASSQLIVEIIP